MILEASQFCTVKIQGPMPWIEGYIMLAISSKFYAVYVNYSPLKLSVKLMGFNHSDEVFVSPWANAWLYRKNNLTYVHFRHDYVFNMLIRYVQTR